jgi:hypothetical protein
MAMIALVVAKPSSAPLPIWFSVALGILLIAQQQPYNAFHRDP